MHQDWTPVVIRKPKTQVVEKSVRATPATSVGNTSKAGVNRATHSTHNTDIPAWKIEKQVDSDTGAPIKRVTTQDAQAIIKGRVAMKLSQTQLAQRLNMPERDIKDIESCKAVENKAVINKIKKFLNIV